MGKETSKRIQTSILNNAEKKVLIWLAKRQPKWMTSDTLTYIGVFGSLLFVVGGALSNLNLNWLWLSSFGLFIHWYGDSLDGTLARVRNTQRPVYGFFIDHTLDAITTFFIFLGAGLSPVLRMDIAMLGLSGYLCLSIYTYICTILKDEFRLTYGCFGPTEFRLLLILINTIYIYAPWSVNRFSVLGCDMGVFDLVGLAVAAILFLIFLTQYLKDRSTPGKQDPPKKPADASGKAQA